MNTCKTCKFWDGDKNERGRICLNDRLCPIRPEHCGTDSAYGSRSSGRDESESLSRVRTGPDFGCIHHEPKRDHAYT